MLLVVCAKCRRHLLVAATLCKLLSSPNHAAGKAAKKVPPSFLEVIDCLVDVLLRYHGPPAEEGRCFLATWVDGAAWIPGDTAALPRPAC